MENIEGNIKIFIGYKTEDKAIVKRLASKLEKYNLDVWWDPKIPAGTHFTQVIKNELLRCDCALILWTKKTLKNPKWVQVETEFAWDKNKLIPLVEGDIQLEFPCAGIQTADISTWDGSHTSPFFQKLLDDIALKSKKKVKLKNEKIKNTPVNEDVSFNNNETESGKEDCNGLDWKQKIEKGNKKDLKKYIELCPNGEYVALALSKIREKMKVKQLYLGLIIVLALVALAGLGVNKS